MKPYAYKESEPQFIGVTACLLKNEPASVPLSQSKWQSHGGTVKASVNSANIGYGYDPKRDELAMCRVKRG